MIPFLLGGNRVKPSSDSPKPEPFVSTKLLRALALHTLRRLPVLVSSPPSSGNLTSYSSASSSPPPSPSPSSPLRWLIPPDISRFSSRASTLVPTGTLGRRFSWSRLRAELQAYVYHSLHFACTSARGDREQTKFKTFPRRRRAAFRYPDRPSRRSRLSIKSKSS